MPILYVEKLGGLAGFGGARARIRSRGQAEYATLSSSDQKAIDTLFLKGGTSHGKGADGFRFQISRDTATGSETIEVNEKQIPQALAKCVKDEFV